MNRLATVLWSSGLALFVAVLAWALIAPVAAQAATASPDLALAAAAAPDAPPIPSAFYGAAKFDDTTVVTGTTVSAWIGGVKYAETSTRFVGSDSVYTIDVPGDDPDTPGVVEGGQEGDLITFQVMGLAAGRVGVWHAGTVAALDLEAYTPGPPAAALRASKGRNVIQGEDGASIVAYSSFWSNSYQPQYAIDFNADSAWCSANGQIANQWIAIRPAGAGLVVVDRALLRNLGDNQATRDFAVQVSTTGAAEGDFTTVVTGTLSRDTDYHEFSFPPIQVRYVRLFLLNNWGSASDVCIRHFQLWTRDREGGIVSLREGPPAQITGYSSANNLTTAAPENVIDENSSTQWATAQGQNTNQWITVRLGGGLVYTVNKIRLYGSSLNEGIRDFQIRASATTTDALAFTTVFSGTAARTTAVQEFSFPSVEARYIQLYVMNVHGANLVRVNTFQVWTADGGATRRGSRG